jgi:membrane-bound serine protease (ClpP class)
VRVGDNRVVFIIAAFLLAVFVLPHPWGVVAVGVAIVAEAVETAFWIRLLRRVPVTAGPETLLGADARVTRACRPIGEVRVNGELWRARCRDGADAGQRVRVEARDGLTLVVRPIPESG